MRINVYVYAQTSAKCFINKKLGITRFRLSFEINWFCRFSEKRKKKKTPSGWKAIKYLNNKILEIQAPKTWNPEW